MKTNNGYVVYKPEDEEILGADHWEVWTGLPEYAFQEMPTRDKDRTGLRFKGRKVYIWVFPDAAELTRRNPKTQLLALGSRRGAGMEFHVMPVDPVKNPIGFAKKYARMKLDELSKAAEKRRTAGKNGKKPTK